MTPRTLRTTSFRIGMSVLVTSLVLCGVIWMVGLRDVTRPLPGKIQYGMAYLYYTWGNYGEASLYLRRAQQWGTYPGRTELHLAVSLVRKLCGTYEPSELNEVEALLELATKQDPSLSTTRAYAAARRSLQDLRAGKIPTALIDVEWTD